MSAVSHIFVPVKIRLTDWYSIFSTLCFSASPASKAAAELCWRRVRWCTIWTRRWLVYSKVNEYRLLLIIPYLAFSSPEPGLDVKIANFNQFIYFYLRVPFYIHLVHFNMYIFYVTAPEFSRDAWLSVKNTLGLAFPNVRLLENLDINTSKICFY